jgi:hypothetical protein
MHDVPIQKRDEGTARHALSVPAHKEGREEGDTTALVVVTCSTWRLSSSAKDLLATNSIFTRRVTNILLHPSHEACMRFVKI